MQYDSKSLYDGLVSSGLIIPTGEPGVFGRSAVFEDVLERFNGLVSQLAAKDGAEKFTFPPTLARSVFEKSGFMKSFPQLAMGVVSFCGCGKDHTELVNRIAEGKSYDDLMTRTGVVLIPAACYPIYPSFTGTLPESGRLVDMTHWVFRHEPSEEPTRMQSFRVREFVRVGSPEAVVDWRNMWLQRGLTLLQSLGLPAQEEVASDPFFGRVGKMLANNQREQRLKFDSERMQYWLKQGAQPTDRVAKFLVSAELIAAPAQRNNPIQGKPKAKAQERIRANAAAADAAAAAAAKAAEAPAAAAAEASE